MSGNKRAGAAGKNATGASAPLPTVISGGNQRRIQVRVAKGAKQAKPKHVGFTAEKRATFLSHFAATCNGTAAAEAAGISERTVYNWRRDNAEFSEAWHAALDQGYARLEAGLVRWAQAAVVVADEAAAGAPLGGFDPKTALAVLEAYRRHMAGARTGGIIAQPYDMEQVRQRLEAKMRALGMLDDEAGDSDGADPEGEGSC
jgi:hypothetical protein